MKQNPTLDWWGKNEGPTEEGQNGGIPPRCEKRTFFASAPLQLGKEPFHNSLHGYISQEPSQGWRVG